MTTAVFEALSYAMRYWFIAIAVGVLIAMIRISYKEYKNKKSVKNELSQYVGYLQIIGGPEEFIDDRFGIREITVIGRSTHDDIVLADPTVEPSHAKLYFMNGNLVLQPGQRGYTTINGRRAAGRHALKTGDVIGIGDVEFAVHIRRRRVGYDS